MTRGEEAIGALPRTSPVTQQSDGPDRPNAILFIIDSLRRDAVGAYGSGWIQTPALDRLAARGAVFEQAYIGSYPCMPARREIWTGRYEFPWRGWGPLEDDDEPFAGRLSSAGVLTQLITDHYHLWESGAGNYHFGFDGADFIRGQENDQWRAGRELPERYPTDRAKLAAHARRGGSYERYARSVGHRVVEREYFAPQVMQAAGDWLERHHAEGPFCLVVDSFDPHEPFDPPPGYERPYLAGASGDRNPWPTYGDAGYLSPGELATVRALYAGEVAMVDRWFGRVLETVDRLGLAPSTLIMVISDHGHLFGEHGLIGKPWAGLADANLYDELARIPFLVAHPGGAGAGRRVDRLVQPVDVYATLLDWFGVQIPAQTHGRSVLPLLEGNPDDWRQYAFFGRYGESVNVTDGRWTLLRWPEAESNEPLYWYSHHRPAFIGARASGPLEDNSRYPASAARGASRSALFDRQADPQQLDDRLEVAPQEARRLEEAIRDFFAGIDAPSEQLRRLGLVQGSGPTIARESARSREASPGGST